MLSILLALAATVQVSEPVEVVYCEAKSASASHVARALSVGTACIEALQQCTRLSRAGDVCQQTRWWVITETPGQPKHNH